MSIRFASAGAAEMVALVGTAGPFPGSSYRSLKLPNVGDVGSFPVAFRGSVKGATGPAQRGLFVGEPGTLASVIILKGSGTPGGGGLFRTFSRPAVESTGMVAWRSRATAVGQGIFLYDGAVRTVVLRDDPIPSGGKLDALSRPAMTGLGGVVFRATVSGNPTIGDGIFMCSGGDATCRGGGSGTFAELVVQGDPVPDRGGRTFCSFETGVRTSSWGIAFRAATKLDCSSVSELVADGVFRMVYGGVAETLGLEGETANLVVGSGSVTYRSFRDPPGIENDGQVVFRAQVQGTGIREDGLYLCDPSTCPPAPAQARFAAGGEDSVIPPHVVRRVASPAIDNNGRVVFFASARGNGQSRAIYKLEPLASRPDPIVIRGDSILGLPGATFHRPFIPNVSPLGKVAFRSRVKGTSGSTGIFLWQ